MKSPLDFYKETAALYDITDELNVSPVAKLTFAQTQVVEQRQIINRLLFDVANTLLKQEQAKDETTRDAYRKKADDYRNDLRQMADNIRVGLQMIKDLRTEYPELRIKE